MNPQELYNDYKIEYSIFEHDLITNNAMSKDFLFYKSFNALVLILNEEKQVKKIIKINDDLNKCEYILNLLNQFPHQNILNYLLNNFDKNEILETSKKIKLIEIIENEINQIFKEVLKEELKDELETKSERKKRRI